MDINLSLHLLPALFSLEDLQEGEYLIKFSAAEKYEKIANLSAMIIGGQHTNLAAVLVKKVA